MSVIVEDAGAPLKAFEVDCGFVVAFEDFSDGPGYRTIGETAILNSSIGNCSSWEEALLI